MRKCITLVSLLLLALNCLSQNVESEFESLVESILVSRIRSYDSIHSKLKAYVNDTVHINCFLEKSTKINYFEGRGYGILSKGDYFVHRSQFNKAKSLYNIGLKEAVEEKNAVFQVLFLIELGAANRQTEKIKTAIDYYLAAQEIVDEVKNPSREELTGLGRVKNSIGYSYLLLKQYDQSIQYFLEAIKIQKELGNTLRLAVNNQNLGLAYEEQGLIDKAMSYYKRSLEYNNIVNSNFGKIICKNSIAQILIKKGEYKEAEEIIKPLIKKIRETGYQHHIASVLINYGWVNFKMSSYKKARLYLDEGLHIAKEYNLQFHIVKVYTLLAELETNQNNFNQALTYFKLAKRHNDNLINNQNNNYINDLSYKYDSERKANKIIALAGENKIVTLKLKQNKKVIYIISIAAFLTLLGLYTAFVQRQKRKDQEIITLKREQQVKTLELLMEGEEKERLRIAKELHDGVNVDLSSIKYKLTSLLEQNNEVINQAVAMIDKSCEQVRAISHNLVPPALKDFSLLEALEDYCSTMNNLHNPNISFHHLGTEVQISKKVEVNIFRIVQELVYNSIKHAAATEIEVQLSNQNKILQLTVEDNGKGFNKDALEHKGIGLETINSRIVYLDAKLDFQSDDKGTSYVIDINTDELT